jgi:hypothetical protein
MIGLRVNDMEPKDLEKLARDFRLCAATLRVLGEDFPSNRANAVVFAANLAASYAEKAAEYVDTQIETQEIGRLVAEETLPCLHG